jgi:hypothetical protein
MARQRRVVDQDVEHLIPTNLDLASSEYHLTVPTALLTRIALLTRGTSLALTHACVAVAQRCRDDDRLLPLLPRPRLRRCRAHPLGGRN